MPASLYKPGRFELPPRIRAEKKPSDKLATRTALIDRIADLRGIETVQRRDNTVPCQVDVYLCQDSKVRRRGSELTPLFCSLNCDGVAVSGLDRWAQHKVISRGWGKLDADRVLVYLPRDRRELSIVWKILRRAHDNLFNPSDKLAGEQMVSTWDWPKFSRTTLQ